MSSLSVPLIVCVKIVNITWCTHTSTYENLLTVSVSLISHYHILPLHWWLYQGKYFVYFTPACHYNLLVYICSKVGAGGVVCFHILPLICVHHVFLQNWLQCCYWWYRLFLFIFPLLFNSIISHITFIFPYVFYLIKIKYSRYFMCEVYCNLLW